MPGCNYAQPAGTLAAELREAFPSYDVSVTLREGDRPRYVLVTRDDDNPWCLISPDADEIRRELKDVNAERAECNA
jgi:hypothetical protein